METKIITVKYQILHHFPNIVAETEEEESIFEKLRAPLSEVETWVFDHLLPYDMVAELSVEQSSLLRTFIVCRAMAQTLPALDVVMTPTGIGIINTDVISPASKERVSALIKSSYRRADTALNTLLSPYHLPSVDGWTDTPQAQWWRNCGCPAIMIPTEGCPSLDRYLGERVEMERVALRMRAEVVGDELFDRLALELQTRKIPSPVAAAMSSIILRAVFTKSEPDKMQIEHLVQMIRSTPDRYPEWHASELAQIWSPPVFENEKDSPAYFF